MDVSTPPSRIPTPNPTATTLRGNASTSMEKWRPQMRHKTPSQVAEPLWQERTPGHLGTTVRSTLRLRKIKSCNLRSYGSSKQSLMKIASASPSSSGSSSRISHTRMAEARADGLERYTDRLSGTGNQSNPSVVSPEQARMSWQRPCCYVTCLNPQTPKRGAFEMWYKLCFKWRQLSKPRAQPLDVEGQPRRSVTSQSETKGRCRSISNRPLEERRQRLSRTTPMVNSGDTMHGTTSMSIVAIDMGMQRSAVTALTTAGGTTATRTEWPRNHRVLACSTERSAAHHYPARFDPRLALLNTTVKPS